MTQARVLLIHGHYGHPWQMRQIARYLKPHFKVKSIFYSSLLANKAQVAAKIYAQYCQDSSTELHLVAHSLGGIIALELLANYADLPAGKLVLIATPYHSSKLAANLAQSFSALPLLVHLLLGKDCAKSLLAPAVWQDVLPQNKRPLLTIAGTKGFGIGSFLNKMDDTQAHDGSVYVAETIIKEATEQQFVQAAHSTVLFKEQTAQMVSRFLRFGSS